jgi:hypothetical protein
MYSGEGGAAVYQSNPNGAESLSGAFEVSLGTVFRNGTGRDGPSERNAADSGTTVAQ